jgi:hypothetical protein
VPVACCSCGGAKLTVVDVGGPVRTPRSVARLVAARGDGYPRQAMAIVEGLSFSYVLHELPRDRLPFRRWRFELWHGARLEAAGWRTHKHASRVAHAMFGLRPPGDLPGSPALRPGAAVRVIHGGIAFALVPRQLEIPDALGALGA